MSANGEEIKRVKAEIERLNFSKHRIDQLYQALEILEAKDAEMEKEPEVDWDKVAIGAGILLKDLEGIWHKSVHLGDVSFMIEPKTFGSWDDERRKLDPEAESIINWIPNTGKKVESREGCVIMGFFKDGFMGKWSGSDYAVTDYAYIKLPVTSKEKQNAKE